MARFINVTGQSLDARSFYDDSLSLSSKTTFEAVTHALMTTPLTDASGQQFGDGLTLIERVDSIKGEVSGTPSDRQFRIYVRLVRDARAMMERSREFRRRMDNSIYHKGYPLNYREQRGTPSIQVSIALDDLHADVDVDYRASTFPLGLFNGHLSAANSDVRAGDNAERHAGQWSGFQNWWRNAFGVRLERVPDASEAPAFALPKVPRAGKQDIKEMVPDFLRAWLVEGDIVAAMGYVSERSYACLAQDMPDPDAFDRGLAPVQILVNLKAAHDALGTHGSLEGLTTGVNLTIPGLRVVPHPQQAQFVLYEVPDDLAARFDCASRLTPGAPTQGSRAYGQHFGATFRVAGPAKNASVALLWAREGGYWKIVSWHMEPEALETPIPPAPPAPAAVRISADAPLVQTAKNFMDSWLVRKNYDAAFRYLSTEQLHVLRPHAGTRRTGIDITRRCRPEDPRKSRTRRPVGRHRAQSGVDCRSCRTPAPVDTRDGSEVLAHVQPDQFPHGSWRGCRVRRARPWRAAARSLAAGIRRRLRHDVPLSHKERRRAGRPYVVA